MGVFLSVVMVRRGVVARRRSLTPEFQDRFGLRRPVEPHGRREGIQEFGEATAERTRPGPSLIAVPRSAQSTSRPLRRWRIGASSWSRRRPWPFGAAVTPCGRASGLPHLHRVPRALRRGAQHGAVAPCDRRSRRRRRHPDPARFVAGSPPVPLRPGHGHHQVGNRRRSRTLANPVCDGERTVTKVEMTLTEAGDTRSRGQISRAGAGSS